MLVLNLMSLLILECFISTIVAHEEKVPVWTQLVKPTSSAPTEVSTYPGPRSKSTVWMDSGKALAWMYGGITGNPGYTSGCPSIKVCSDGVLLDELWLYNILSDNWKLIQSGNSSNVPESRHSAVTCGQSDENLMVLFGGYNSNNEVLSDTWIFDVINKYWHRRYYNSGRGECSEHPEGRAAMLHWCTSDALWILGGIDSDDNVLSDMWRFNFATGCWTRQQTSVYSNDKPNLTISLRPQPDSPTWVLNDKELIFLSNVTDDKIETKSNQTCELWTMSTDNLLWKPYKLTPQTHQTSVSHDNTYVKFLGDTPPCRISAASWVDENDNFWLFGGHRHIPRFINRTSVYVCDIWLLETNNNTWIKWFQKKYTKVEKYLFQTVPSHLTVPTPRAHAMSWFYNGTLYLFGGESRNGDNDSVKYLNDFWRWHMGHPEAASRKLLLPPIGVFFVTLGALCLLAVCVFGSIFVAKATSPQAPRLKPPTYNGKIKYSPVSTTEDVLFEAYP
ncbi:uncharacterized protein [Amphiura filiformis]|uniref:uncharacterized protein n=1 Tax=Amphiura filiformis TaxID=82378 RepID=UPI003B20B84D